MDATPAPSGSRSPIAIVGLGCVFPGAPDVDAFWRLVIEGRSAIGTVTPDRWDPEAFWDPDHDKPDRTYSRVGGFIRDWRFDGRDFRIPPATARVMDRAQQYALTAAQQAFAHAGLDRTPFDRDRAAVIFGLAGERMENEEQVIQRVQWPMVEQAVQSACTRQGLPPARQQALLDSLRGEYLRDLVEVTEDTFAGLCPNVVAGRVASFLDLHGPSYVVDAACASSLAALDCAADALHHGDADLALCGGVHGLMGLCIFIGFCKFHGLSTSGVRPFDAAADGFLLGEGAGCFVLKRLEDAIRDGDRVWAVVRGIGSSSDGREKSISAPTPQAQALAMRRAFDEAGYSPATVQLIETHGVGTPVGDPAEIEATHEVFGPALAADQRVAITAVKSNVGHLMGAAGAAGILKTVLGMHHRVMAQTINHTHPNPAIPWDRLPFDLLTTARPWPANRDGLPRRANVSSFGFGGNNFHVALEEFDAHWHRTLPAALRPPREPVAIVGIGACLPKAPDAETFWQNIVHRTSAIESVPSSRWEGRPGLFVDANPDAPDKTYSPIGGFGEAPDVDARRLRVTPASMPQIDPAVRQLAATAFAAVEAADLPNSPKARTRTAVIVGGSVGNRYLTWTLAARVSARRAEVALHRVASAANGPVTPDVAQSLGLDVVRQLTADRTPCTEDSVVGIAMSIGPARVAKALDLMGTHMVVDAACGSSLAAITVAVRGLQAGKWDAVITGGVAGGITPHMSILASKARALSGIGSRPLDARADGFVGGEGAVTFLLKRLSDAVKAGDCIHGVIRGVGASTNGRGPSMYAPDARREALALSRAYADAGLPPASVQYIECHATATAVGDTAEVEALRLVFGARAEQALHLGAVKSQIGHTEAAAGAAGLLKALLGLARKTLPPMPAVATPIQAVTGTSPFRLVTAATPWPSPDGGEPRRAGVNAFGFGGTNWHVVVEEHLPAYHAALAAGFASTSGGEAPLPRLAAVQTPAASQIPSAERPMSEHAPRHGDEPVGFTSADHSVGGSVAARSTRSRGGTGERIWITGISVGLPGTQSRVFSDTGVERLLSGACFIEPVPEALQDRLVAKRITRLVKTEGGEPRLEQVTSRDEAVKLAAQRGGFSLRDDFGVHEEWLADADIAYQLAVAAGLDCLRDARIPLQRAHRRTSRGGSLQTGWMLPAPLQDETGVVFGAAFAGLNMVAEELGRYYRATFGAASATAIRTEYLKRIDAAQTDAERLQADQWFIDERRRQHVDGAGGGYRFNRNFVADYLCTGNARFAQLVRARGPNLAVSAACSSTATALATAEDMIRAGRARRVVVLAADDVSSDVLFEWVGAGFLAAGAAATDRKVADAAIPFDRRRHGMILGMGAVGFVLETEAAARERGVTPVAELLGVRLANSASHMTRPDADHLVGEMAAFLGEMRARHGIDARELAPNLVYGSHETCTSPSGGIGAVEGRMLKQTFGDRWRDVLVVNTKCATGHAQGAGLEEAIIMKGLHAGKVPPVLHTRELDPELAGMSLSTGGETTREYALRFSAGFGSQLGMVLTRVGPRGVPRTASEARYQAWLEEVTGVRDARVTVVKRVLHVEGAGVDGTIASVEPAARHSLAAATPPSPSRAPSVPESPSAPGMAAAMTAKPVKRPAITPPPAAIADRVLAIIEEKTGYERQYLELDLDLEADLGIDTIKQAQVMAKIRETFSLPKDQTIRVKDFPTLRHVVRYVETGTAADPAGAAAEPAAGMQPPPPIAEPSAPERGVPVLVSGGRASAAAGDEPAAMEGRNAIPEPVADRPGAQPIVDTILAIVEEKTGYERQYLELDLDLEADLGIDTIKQAQVMAKIREAFALPKDQSIRVKDFPTLRHVVRYVEGRQGAAAMEPPPPTGEASGHTGSSAGDAAVVSNGPPGAAPTMGAGHEAPPLTLREVEIAQPAAVHAGPSHVLDTVLAIIEEKTGYERQYLELDLDLEADLGVDTIKQAQVMARIREAFDLPREQGIRVKDFPTIRHVVNYINGRLPEPASSAPADDATATVSASGVAATPPATGAPVGIRRMAVRWAALDLAKERSNAPIDAGWTVLLTDDGLGVSDAMASALTGAGACVEILRRDSDFDAARERLGAVRALVMLHPLAQNLPVAELDAEQWRAALDRKVAGTFRLLKRLKGELELAVGVTSMAGPYGWPGELVDPAGAGVAGLLKSFRHEAGGALVKAIDVGRPETGEDAARLANTVLQEIMLGGRRVEVAYREGTRLVPRVVPEPLDLSSPAVRQMGDDSVILAFGGSRGVTAAVVKELARRYRPRLVLAGTRSLPANIAELAALDATALRALKQTLAREGIARKGRIKPIDVERKYAETLLAIEAFRTIQACEAAGASVSYESCDVRDGSRVLDLIRDVLARHGRIDGVVFGAGTIEDKLIEDKTPESFARVLGIKAEGIFNVCKALDGISLSFLAAFSSVAGRFGNRGQADYAAGNEVLARFIGLAQAARPDTRCVAFDWTGWSEVGLAARSGIIELMAQAGFEALSPAEGARFFVEEMAFGSGPEEIVVASADLPVDADGQMVGEPGTVPSELAATGRAGVFLGVVHGYQRGAWLSASTSLNPATDRWLRDHVIEGAPLMPAVFGIELMVEAACRLFPGFHPLGVHDLRLHLAVKVLKDRPVTLKVSAVGRAGELDHERIVRVLVTSDFSGPDGRVLVTNRLHYSCDVRLGAAAPLAADVEVGLLAHTPAAESMPPLYGEGGTLPHGPAFRVIERIDGLDSHGVRATVAALDERRVLPDLNGHRLLTLPFAREAAFQSAGLWGLLQHHAFGLPHGCRALHRFGEPPEGTRLEVRVAPRAVDAVRMEYDIDVVGDDGRLYDRMEGFYTVDPRAATELSADSSIG